VSEPPQTKPEPLEVTTPIWKGRRDGVLWILGLHALFLGLTAGIEATLGQESEESLTQTWLLWLGLLQGIYVFPAVLSAALVQRWQLMIGMVAAASCTLAISLIRLVLS
jgi:hypothetical protein